MQPMTPEDVQAVLDRHQFNVQITFFDTTTATSQQAADNIGCDVAQIVKSICFIAGEQPVIVLTSGAQRVDDRKIAALFGIGRKQVRAAKPEECVDVFGYAPGSVPPFPHRTPGIVVYIDQTLQNYPMLYAAGGAHNAIFPVTLAQLVAVTNGMITDVIKDATVPSA
ncbi:MAG: YbaK/EbsC family protein [Chloroflexi bacterium]|nr:YbaK/EbsC family protein [Chloroflexota bacterium]